MADRPSAMQMVKHIPRMAACCAGPILGLALLAPLAGTLGIGFNAIVSSLLVLACPLSMLLMMYFMMRGQKDERQAQGRAEGPYRPSPTALGRGGHGNVASGLFSSASAWLGGQARRAPMGLAIAPHRREMAEGLARWRTPEAMVARPQDSLRGTGVDHSIAVPNGRPGKGDAMLKHDERERSRFVASSILGALVFSLLQVAAGAAALDTLQALPATQQRPAPAFTLPDHQGQTVRLADLRGKVVVVRFWVTW
jgi:hypothetical protein